MGIISVRLNLEEEKMMNFLVDYFEEDKSELIKHSLRDLYEDLKDREMIEDFEKREKRGKKMVFINAETLRKRL